MNTTISNIILFCLLFLVSCANNRGKPVEGLDEQEEARFMVREFR